MPLSIQENEPTKSVVKNELILAKTNLKDDWPNVFLLLLFYLMQGLPIGSYTAILILLQSKNNITYNDQALFGLAVLPFGLKLLWAPLVDSFYVQKMGRRKSWLIPVQFLLGACFFYMANSIEDLLPETGKPNLLKLTTVVILCNFLAATQDIVVDGWALNLLQKNNVGYASTCASVGQVMGATLSAVSLIKFTSEDFSNKYLRIIPSSGGIITMRSLFLVLAILFVTITALIAIFKNEKDNTLEDNEIKLNTFQNYILLLNIFKLPCIRVLAIAMLTWIIGLSPSDEVVNIKLVDVGVPKDNLMIIQTGMHVMQIIIPVIAAKYTAGPKPMSIYLNIIPFKLFWNLSFLIFIYCVSKLPKNNDVVDIPMYYYAMLVFIQSINLIQYNIMITALVAFNCRISDDRFGGTYMTLLNTLLNFGRQFAKFVLYTSFDLLTVKECTFDSKNNCSNSLLQNVCKSNGGDCMTIVNGYYVETILCTIIGIIWYIIFKNKLKEMQCKNPSHWQVKINIQESENYENSYELNVIT